jgi:hypothetical protein
MILVKASLKFLILGNTYGVIIETGVSLVAALYVYYGDRKGRCFQFVLILSDFNSRDPKF